MFKRVYVIFIDSSIHHLDLSAYYPHATPVSESPSLLDLHLLGRCHHFRCILHMCLSIIVTSKTEAESLLKTMGMDSSDSDDAAAKSSPGGAPRPKNRPKAKPRGKPGPRAPGGNPHSRHCGISPSFRVLEVTFGIGISRNAKLICRCYSSLAAVRWEEW